MEKLPAFADIPQHVVTLELGARTYRYRRTYKPRLGAWYIDVMYPDGTLIVAGRRLSGGGFPLGDVIVDFVGTLYVQGADVYLRTDLGTDLMEIYIGAQEIPKPPAQYLETYT